MFKSQIPYKLFLDGCALLLRLIYHSSQASNCRASSQSSNTSTKPANKYYPYQSAASSAWQCGPLPPWTGEKWLLISTWAPGILDTLHTFFEVLFFEKPSKSSPHCVKNWLSVFLSFVLLSLSFTLSYFSSSNERQRSSQP